MWRVGRGGGVEKGGEGGWGRVGWGGGGGGGGGDKTAHSKGFSLSLKTFRRCA